MSLQTCRISIYLLILITCSCSDENRDRLNESQAYFQSLKLKYDSKSRSFGIAMDSATGKFLIKLSVCTGIDTGQHLGTLFELRGGENLLGAAGFQESVNSAVYRNNRILNFFLYTEERKPEITDLGRPFTHVFGDIRLCNYRDTLLAIAQPPGSPQLKSIFNGRQWIRTAHFKGFTDNLAWVIPVGNEEVYCSSSQLIYQDRQVFLRQHTTILAAHLYCGKLYIMETNNAQDTLYISAYSWNGGDPVLSSTNALPAKKKHEFPYIWLGVGKKAIIFGTNLGRYIRFEDGVVNIREKAVKRYSYQVYAGLRYRNEWLLGQYPEGDLGFLDTDSLLVTHKPLPISLDVSTLNREIQSLAIYAGNLYAGIWPWGELDRLNLLDYRWVHDTRFFALPEKSREQTPFVEFFKDRTGTFNNAWGQRLNQMVVCNNTLYIATSNKNNSFNSRDTNLLGADVLDQYGKVYSYSLPAHLTSTPVWLNDTTHFEFGYDGTYLFIVQDGDTLKKSRFVFPDRFHQQDVEISIGKGLYGVSEVEIDLEN